MKPPQRPQPTSAATPSAAPSEMRPLLDQPIQDTFVRQSQSTPSSQNSLPLLPSQQLQAYLNPGEKIKEIYLLDPSTGELARRTPQELDAALTQRNPAMRSGSSGVPNEAVKFTKALEKIFKTQPYTMSGVASVALIIALESGVNRPFNHWLWLHKGAGYMDRFMNRMPGMQTQVEEHGHRWEGDFVGFQTYNPPDGSDTVFLSGFRPKGKSDTDIQWLLHGKADEVLRKDLVVTEARDPNPHVVSTLAKPELKGQNITLIVDRPATLGQGRFFGVGSAPFSGKFNHLVYVDRYDEKTGQWSKAPFAAVLGHTHAYHGTKVDIADSRHREQLDSAGESVELVQLTRVHFPTRSLEHTQAGTQSSGAVAQKDDFLSKPLPKDYEILQSSYTPPPSAYAPGQSLPSPVALRSGTMLEDQVAKAIQSLIAQMKDTPLHKFYSKLPPGAQIPALAASAWLASIPIRGFAESESLIGHALFNRENIVPPLLRHASFAGFSHIALRLPNGDQQLVEVKILAAQMDQDGLRTNLNLTIQLGDDINGQPVPGKGGIYQYTIGPRGAQMIKDRQGVGELNFDDPLKRISKTHPTELLEKVFQQGSPVFSKSLYALHPDSQPQIQFTPEPPHPWEGVFTKSKLGGVFETPVLSAKARYLESQRNEINKFKLSKTELTGKILDINYDVEGTPVYVKVLIPTNAAGQNALDPNLSPALVPEPERQQALTELLAADQKTDGELQNFSVKRIEIQNYSPVLPNVFKASPVSR